MLFREAEPVDIPQMQRVRHSVKENVLSDPGLVTDDDCLHYITHRGKGWVADANGTVVGFAIADVIGNNIWALFVNPAFERKGIGKKLHDMMMDWYFSQTDSNAWLSTEPRSRAEYFYRKAGWIETGVYGKGEVKFEMTKETWQKQKKATPL
jgi:GNAT superfamily N-acetyltransferase